jgi:hypothetical protein
VHQVGLSVLDLGLVVVVRGVLDRASLDLRGDGSTSSSSDCVAVRIWPGP